MKSSGVTLEVTSDVASRAMKYPYVNFGGDLYWCRAELGRSDTEQALLCLYRIRAEDYDWPADSEGS